MNTTRIGFDLDNTMLGSGPDGKNILQGFKAFATARREAGHALLILCHLNGKTEESVAAEIAGQGFFTPVNEGGYGFHREDLICIQSPSGLIQKIKALRLTHYVGTDTRLFNDGFPASTQPLLLGDALQGKSVPAFADWSGLTDFFTWEKGLPGEDRLNLGEIKTISVRDDNAVYKVNTRDGRGYVLKYFDASSGNERVGIEAAHLVALHELGVTNVPKSYGREGSWALYEWREGTPVTEPTPEHAEALADMLVRLQDCHGGLIGKDLHNAANARTCLRDYVTALNDQWNAVLRAAQRPEGPKDVMMFLMTDMEQMRQDNLNHLYLWSKRKGWDLDQPLPASSLFFSPGDFGIHNVLQDGDDLVFLDFKHSGWDDAARVMADFFLNPEQNLPLDLKLQVLERFVKERKNDPNFLERFWAVADSVAVEWILHALKVVIPEEMRHLQFKKPGIDPDLLVAERLELAKKMREEFQPMEHLCKHHQLLEDESEIG
jgi:hypothetical protein